MARLVDSPAWKNLQDHAGSLPPLARLVLDDARRLQNCEIRLDGLRFNYAFNQADAKTIGLLLKLAEQEQVAAARDRMFRGEKINTTENRAALHTVLRQEGGKAILVEGRDVLQDIAAMRAQMAKFADGVRSGNYKGSTGKPIRTVINIGIGGSDLGPRLAVEALVPFASGPEVRFVANADAFDLISALKGCDPAETLFVIVSKTFATQETLLNAATAKKWLVGKLGADAVARHFVAVTGNPEEARKMGISGDLVFPMWDWVGGRFSLWSAVGLGIALAVGMENFEKMLAGARAMDEHFLNAPLNENMPVILALLAIWQRDFLGRAAHAILPYAERLRILPRYLQQLEMESGGKTATKDGNRTSYATAPVIFGECGTVGQHSFHQWLHQGSDIASVDFIGVTEDDLGKPEHHGALLANMVAQAGALAFGHGATVAQDVYDGNRPSNLLMLDRLDPYGFGMLLALYEHKIFVQGAIWNINVFDQPGVELGKKIARGLESGGAAGDAQSTFLAAILKHLSGNPL